MKRMEEHSMRTILVAAVGFAGLLAVVPAWARAEVALFGVLFGALAYALDESVRAAVRRVLDSGPSRNDARSVGNDATKAAAKSPASHRAAT